MAQDSFPHIKFVPIFSAKLIGQIKKTQYIAN